MNKHRFKFKLYFIIWSSILTLLIIVFSLMWTMMFKWYNGTQIRHLKNDLKETTILLSDYYVDDINQYIKHVEEIEILYGIDLRIITIVDNDIVDYKIKKSFINDIDLSQIEKIKNQQFYILEKEDIYYCFSKINTSDEQLYLMNSCPTSLLYSNLKAVNINLLITLSFSFLLSLGLTYIFSKYITKPITVVAKQAMMLDQKDYVYNPKETNIVEIDDIQASLIKLQNRLEETEKLEKEFLSSVSHELKSPLTIIKSYSEMIKDFSLDDQELTCEYLDIINEQIDVLNKHINDMTMISKIQANAYEDKYLLDVNSMLVDIYNDFKPDIIKKEIEFNLYVDKNIKFYANTLCIKYCFTNYISNSIKYTNNKIDVKFYKKDSNIIFEVINNGPMILKEDINNIWNHFDKNNSNSGIGLAIVRTICEHSNYKYSVDSNEENTIFRIIFEE